MLRLNRQPSQCTLSPSTSMPGFSTASKSLVAPLWVPLTKSSLTRNWNLSCSAKSCSKTKNPKNITERNPMFRAIKRLFIWMGLMAEKATETDAINQAVVERGIRDSKAKADKAHYANGQLAGQIALLKDQIKRQERQRQDLQGMLQAAAAANDEANGAHYAEELATLESDLNDNKAQADNLQQLYQQNTQIIAQSLREIQKFQQEFEATKTKVAIGRSLENLSGMMKSSITELQGMMGGEMSQSMQQLRQSAAGGEGQMRATLDLAKAMGSDISRQQEMRKARGSMLFQEYKKKMGMVQPDAAATTQSAPPATPERQKIAEQ